MDQTAYQISIAGTEVSFPCAAGDTVLRAAQRHGLGFPYECNVGACGNCRFELLAGLVESLWPQAPGLSEKDRQRNRWLGCQTRPQGGLSIKLRTAEQYKPVHRPLRTQARLIGSRAITHDLYEFRFELDQPMQFASGQYALIHLPGVAGPRAYSMSQAGEGPTQVLEFQVRRVPQGAGTKALFDGLQPGQAVQIDGPYGMAYLRQDTARPILCVAGGSGLAPMLSVARGAFASAALSQRRLHFVYGARLPQDVCGLDMLEALPGWKQRGSYQAAVSGLTDGQDTPAGCVRGFVHEAVDQLYGGQLADFEIYFAGPVLMAQAVLKLLVERKVPMAQVHFDQFY